MKKTEWYPGDMKPVRDGVYERDLGPPNFPCFAKFSARRWYYSAGSIKMAAESTLVSDHQNESGWRGLAQDPELKIIAVAGVPRAIRKGEIEVLMSDTTIKRMRIRDRRSEDWAEGVDGSYEQGREFLQRKAEVK